MEEADADRTTGPDATLTGAGIADFTVPSSRLDCFEGAGGMMNRPQDYGKNHFFFVHKFEFEFFIKTLFFCNLNF